MTEEVKLWVCPNCDILQGIDVQYSDGEFKARCVNCGVPLDIEDVKFITPELAKAVILRTEEILDEDMHTYVRYHWVSNKTVGIVFELSYREAQEFTSVDVMNYFENELGPELGITMTVYFE